MTVEPSKNPHPKQKVFRQKIFQVLMAVPKGKVVTYGQVAELAGLGKGGRLVGTALRGLPADTNIPWHRVINAQGKISLPEPGAGIQKERLRSEQIWIHNGRIDLGKYQWKPQMETWDNRCLTDAC